MSAISGTTRVVAILGDPVEHSRSPALHNAAFAALDLDFVYVALRVEPPELARAIAGVRALGLAGLNVTVPHKQRILPLLDRVSERARRIGAVNTVHRNCDALEGENTDAEGFLRDLRRIGFRPRGKTAVLLGAGGSARAVAWALAETGLERLLIVNRTRSRASSLARAIRSAGADATDLDFDAAFDRETLRGADLIVNATSIGLGSGSFPTLSLAATPRACLCYDLVYGAKPTAFVRFARGAGRRATDGRGMLLEQAGLAFRFWTGRRAPLRVMARTLALPTSRV